MNKDIEFEFEIKTVKPPTPEQEEELNIKKLTSSFNIGENELPDLETEYRKMVINLKDIQGRLEFDEDHTVLFLKFGAFITNIPFAQFNIIYEQLTNSVIRRASDFQIVVEPEIIKPEPKTKRRRFRDEEDDKII